MKKFQVLSVIAVLCAWLMLAAAPGALATPYTWNYAGDGNWSDASKWSPSGGPPNNTIDTAWVDNTGNNVNVSVNSGSTVNQLKVDAGDTVSINNGVQLSLSGTSPGIDVAGTVSLNSGGSWTTLYADNLLNLTGGGKVVLNGTYSRINGAVGSQVTNAFGNSIEGYGEINANLDNRGGITAKGGTLQLKNSITVNNSGVMTTNASGDILWLNGVTVTGTGRINPGAGQVNLSGAFLKDHTLGAGAVQVATASSFYGAMSLDAGTEITVPNGVELLAYKNGSTAASLSGGTINMETGGSWTGLRAWNPLLLNSKVMLSGPYTRIYGEQVTNALGNSIEGQGRLQAAMVNNGTITAKGGTLEFEAITVDNSHVITTDASSDTLWLYNTSVSGIGQINPGAGLLKLSGASLTDHTLGPGAVQVDSNSKFYGAMSLDAGTQITVPNGVELLAYNNGSTAASLSGGTINIEGGGNWTSLRAMNPLLLNSKVVLSGANAGRIYGEQVTNASGNSIEGQGRLQAAIVNNGTITAKNGTLYVERAITGTGKVSVTDAATLNLVNVDVHTGNFEMLGSAALTGGSGRTFNLTKNFTFTQTDEAKWNGGAGFRLQMSGASGHQALEVGGLDSGAVAAGFTSNFHLDRLSLTESATYAYLTDAYNNGNRGGSDSPPGGWEALYVDTLALADDTTLNLNGLHLYTSYLGSYVEVFADDARFGGTIINSPVPLPGTLLLLGSGLLGLAGLRRRFMQN